MRKKRKPRWRRVQLAHENLCHCTISNGQPFPYNIYVEHNRQYKKGAPIVNRLGRKITQWLNEQNVE